MEHIGIDVHEVESQIRILTESGEIVERRIRTERERFAAVLGGRAPAKIVSEASTETESVGRCLEKLGHEVGGRPELRRDVRDAEPQGDDDTDGIFDCAQCGAIAGRGSIASECPGEFFIYDFRDGSDCRSARWRFAVVALYSLSHGVGDEYSEVDELSGMVEESSCRVDDSLFTGR